PGEVNPRGEIAPLFTGHAPVTTAAEPFLPPPAGDGADVVHARVDADARIAVLGEGPADLHVRRVVKVDPPAVDPDDGNGLGRLLRRGKDRTALDEDILRPNMDEFFPELPGCFGAVPSRARLPRQESDSCKSEPGHCGDPLLLHHGVSYHYSLYPSKWLTG